MTKIQPDIINFAEKCVSIPTLENDSTQNIVLNEWQKEKLNEWQNNNKNNYMFTCQHEPGIGCSTIQLIQALYNVTFKNDAVTMLIVNGTESFYQYTHIFQTMLDNISTEIRPTIRKKITNPPPYRLEFTNGSRLNIFKYHNNYYNLMRGCRADTIILDTAPKDGDIDAIIPIANKIILCERNVPNN